MIAEKSLPDAFICRCQCSFGFSGEPMSLTVHPLQILMGAENFGENPLILLDA